MSTLRRLQRSLAVAGRIPGELRAPYHDPERIAERRDRRVREVVRLAAEHVPHYRALGLDPREIRTAGDLVRLPLLSKQEVQRDPGRFVAGTAAGRDAVRFHTSGSSGMPLDIWHDRASLLANIAYSERERAVETRLLGRRVRYRIVSFGLAPSMTRQVQNVYGRESFRPLRPDQRNVVLTRPLERVVAELNELRADVWTGYGSYIESLLRRADAYGLRVALPRVVIAAGDAITPAGKAFIEDGLGIPVLQRYAAVETLKIAFTCEQGSYHLHDDLCHVRSVGGELVITNLVNRGTVLINYRIGDLGDLAPGRCPCGRGLPLLAGLRGRVSEAVELPDGELVHSVGVWGEVRDVPGILQFQLVQHEPRVFELRLVTADGPDFDHAASAALPGLRRLLAGATVEAVRYDELPPAESGKFATVLPLR